MSAATTTRRQKNSLGCLGCLAVPTLSIMSLVLVGLLAWLNPRWIDRYTFWRAPLVEDSGQLFAFASDDAEMAQQLGGEIETTDPAQRPSPAGLQRFEFAKASAEYDPQRGGEVVDPTGLRLSVPARALGSSGTLTVTPIAQLPEDMAAPFLGPIYDIRFGDIEDLRFERPATLTLPYASVLDPTDGHLAVWEHGEWVPVRARLDLDAHTLTAEIHHASLWTTISGPLSPAASRLAGGAVGMALWAATSGTARGIVRSGSAWWNGAEGFETPEGNFQFHYFKSGPNAVPSDESYLTIAGTPEVSRPVTGVPLYVQDLGFWLEQCRAGLEDLGLPLPEALVTRYDVFLSPMDGVYGASGLGGPLLISTDLAKQASDHQYSSSNLMRSVSAHELVHVAQSGYSVILAGTEYSARGISSAISTVLPAGDPGQELFSQGVPARKWWIEMTAEYIANFYWEEERGHSLAKVSERYQRTANLPADSMIGAADPIYYDYASFLSWLDTTQGPRSAFRWIRAVDDGWTANLSAIDAEARTAFGGRGLVDLFRAFAFDYYHDDLWRGHRFASLHKDRNEINQAMQQSSGVSQRFILVARDGSGNAPGVDPGRKASIIDQDWRRHSTERLAPLTAEAIYLSFDGLPETRQAKLVIHVEPLGSGDDELTTYLALDRVLYSVRDGQDYQLPFSGEPGELEAIDLSGAKGFVKVVEKIGSESDPNRATLITVNESLDRSARGLLVERWLLLPPEYVEYRRESDDSPNWELQWKHVGLASQAPAFETYRVYRKPAGAPDEAFEAVLDTSENIVTVRAPDDGDHAFTIRVVDVLGNESADAPVSDASFVGSWSGTIRLVDGAFVQPWLEWGELEAKKAITAKETEIANARNSETRQRLQAEHDQDLADYAEFREKVRPFLDKAAYAENALRLGVPFSFSIRKVAGHYEFRPVGFGPWDLGEQEWVRLSRLGLHELGFTAESFVADSPEKVDPADRALINAMVEDYLKENLGTLKGFDITPPTLRLHRSDPRGDLPTVIRSDAWSFAIPMTDNRQLSFTLSWDFERD